MEKTNKMVTIYDGHSHIERRIYSDNSVECIKINGSLFTLDWCFLHFESVDIWF